MTEWPFLNLEETGQTVGDCSRSPTPSQAVPNLQMMYRSRRCFLRHVDARRTVSPALYRTFSEMHQRLRFLVCSRVLSRGRIASHDHSSWASSVEEGLYLENPALRLMWSRAVNSGLRLVLKVCARAPPSLFYFDYDCRYLLVDTLRNTRRCRENID